MLDANGHYSGNLIISETQSVDLNKIVSVGGNMSIEAEAQLPVLTRVGGYLSIRAKAQLPVITSVGGDLYIGAEAQLPALTSVVGFLYIGREAQLPVLTSVGGYLSILAEAQLPALKKLYGHDVATDGVTLLAVARQIIANPQSLDMATWHQPCGTVHCLAGHGVHQAGETGYALEQATNPTTAAAIILGIEAANYFFRTKDNSAFEFLQRVVAKADA